MNSPRIRRRRKATPVDPAFALSRQLDDIYRRKQEREAFLKLFGLYKIAKRLANRKGV